MDLLVNRRAGSSVYLTTVNPILRDMLPRNGFQRLDGERFFACGRFIIAYTPANWTPTQITDSGEQRAEPPATVQ
jgi:hypothetical protein